MKTHMPKAIRYTLLSIRDLLISAYCARDAHVFLIERPTGAGQDDQPETPGAQQLFCTD